MLKPDDSALLHGKVYDAAKAREYYLRTRVLKGRKPGGQQEGPGPRGNTATLTKSRGNTATSTKSGNNDSKKLAATAKTRTEALQARLDKLRDLLAQLVAQAKGRSGVEKPSKSDDTQSPAEKQATDKGKSPLSAKEKTEAAKRSKEHYEKNKDLKGPSNEAAELTKDIAEVQEQIRDIRKDLKASVDKARQQMSAKSMSKTASKGR